MGTLSYWRRCVHRQGSKRASVNRTKRGESKQKCVAYYREFHSIKHSLIDGSIGHNVKFAPIEVLPTTHILAVAPIARYPSDFSKRSSTGWYASSDTRLRDGREM
mmetsp:Transcript_8080/g.23233  ORF Transcript_8080/g.23233 Transcript_8080/m.23233 type:complete len:105 (-) Transcript_8080:940-1254(-)